MPTLGITRSGIRPALKTALEAVEALAGIPVFIETRHPTRVKEIEDALQPPAAGIAIVLTRFPFCRRLPSQRPGTFTQDILGSVQIRANEVTNDARGEARRDLDDLVEAVEAALVAYQRAGAVWLDLGDEGFLSVDVPEDKGLSTTAIHYNARLLGR